MSNAWSQIRLKLLSTRANAGFTLIEILVAASIMALLVGGGISAYFQFEARQKVVAVTREIRDLMNAAQIRARNKDVPVGCGASDFLVDYQVALSGNEVQLIGRCALEGKGWDPADPTDSTPTAIVFSNSTVKIPTGVNVSMTSPVSFLPLEGGVRENSTITVENTLYEAEFTVTRASSSISEVVITKK